MSSQNPAELEANNLYNAARQAAKDIDNMRGLFTEDEQKLYYTNEINTSRLLDQAMAEGDLPYVRVLTEWFLNIRSKLRQTEHAKSGPPAPAVSLTPVKKGRFDGLSSDLSNSDMMDITPAPPPPRGAGISSSLLTGGSMSTVGASSLLGTPADRMRLAQLGSSPASFTMNSPGRNMNEPYPFDKPFSHLNYTAFGVQDDNAMTNHYKPHRAHERFFQAIEDPKALEALDKVYRSKRGATAFSGYADYSSTWHPAMRRSMGLLYLTYSLMRDGDTSPQLFDIQRGILAIQAHEIDAVTYKLRKARLELRRERAQKTRKKAVARAKGEDNETTIKSLKRKLAECLKEGKGHGQGGMINIVQPTDWRKIYKKVRRRYNQ